MKKALFLLSLFAFSHIKMLCQIETKMSLDGEQLIMNELEGLIPDKVITSKIYSLPFFDKEKMIKEDAEMEKEDVPFRFGKGFDVSYSISDGEWMDISGGRLWTISFTSEAALSLNFIFKDFFLPKGAFLYIANKDRTVVYGPIKSEMITKGCDFMTDIIAGSCSTIYLFEPSIHIGESTLTVSRIIHGYRPIVMSYGNYGASASCNVNVACHPEYNAESDAVALVLLGDGTELCSGSLVITTDYSFKPYFLTAFHCLDRLPYDYNLSDVEKNAASSFLFKFCYKTRLCNGSSLLASKTYNGANVMSSYVNSDFALLKLFQNVENDKKQYFLGWDNSGNTPTEGVCLHHPAGDVMKISIDEDPLTSTYWNYDNTHWRTIWDEGNVQPGSSGSPLLNQNRMVVGQLHGALPEDGNDNPESPCDVFAARYGKFSTSWIGQNNSTTRLSDWLDSLGTNQQTIMGSYPWYISAIYQPDDSRVFTVENLPNGFNVNWDLLSTQDLSPVWINNYPSQNQSTMLTDTTLVEATVRASIIKDGIVRRVLEKEIYRDYGFSGTYSQQGNVYNMHVYPSIPNTLFLNNSTIHVNMQCEVTLTSDHFKSMDITITGSPIWNNNGNGVITLFVPYTQTPVNMLVRGRNGDYKHFEFHIIAHPSNGAIVPEEPILDVAPIQDGYAISLKRIDESRNLVTLEKWNIGITDAATGKVMYSKEVRNGSLNIITARWPSGIYIVKGSDSNSFVTSKLVIR